MSEKEKILELEAELKNLHEQFRKQDAMYEDVCNARNALEDKCKYYEQLLRRIIGF